MTQSITRLHLRHLLVMICCLGLIGLAGFQLFKLPQEASRAGLSPVAISSWTSAAQYRLGDPRFGYLILIAASGLGIFISGIALYRATLRSVRHDIKSLGRLFKDVRDGAVRVDYPMMLAEFTDIFRYLRDSGSKLAEKQKQLKKMGLLDHLSRLNNRRHFEARLTELFSLAKTNGPSSVLIIDLDHFKSVNDRHGHDAGDALIVNFSAALKSVVRKSDFLARLGGDEFCIIYSYTDLQKAKLLVERLRRELPREILLKRNVVHQLRWTGGLSVIADSDTKFDQVLWRADQALLEAKQAGRNTTRVHDPTIGLVKKNTDLAS